MRKIVEKLAIAVFVAAMSYGSVVLYQRNSRVAEVQAKFLTGGINFEGREVDSEPFGANGVNRFLEIHRVGKGDDWILAVTEIVHLGGFFDDHAISEYRVTVRFAGSKRPEGMYELSTKARSPLVVYSRVNKAYGHLDGVGCGGIASNGRVTVAWVNESTAKVDVDLHVEKDDQLRAFHSCAEVSWHRSFFAKLDSDSTDPRVPTDPGP